MARLVFADVETFRQAEETRDGTRVWTLDVEAGGGAAPVTVVQAAGGRREGEAAGEGEAGV